MLENILNILFPPKCEMCGKLGNYICNNCYKELDKYELHNDSKEEYFLYRYDDQIRSMLINYKFNDKSYLRDLFAYCILKNKLAIEFIKQYDIIIPVPLHKKRKRERGYNQSELVISKVINNLNENKLDTRLPILERNILKKIKNTKPQSTNKLEDRIQSVKDIYKVDNIQKLTNKSVLVFDDIYTTGSTYNECKKVLINAGAREIGIMTIARDFMKVL